MKNKFLGLMLLGSLTGLQLGAVSPEYIQKMKALKVKRTQGIAQYVKYRELLAEVKNTNEEFSIEFANSKLLTSKIDETNNTYGLTVEAWSQPDANMKKTVCNTITPLILAAKDHLEAMKAEHAYNKVLIERFESQDSFGMLDDSEKTEKESLETRNAFLATQVSQVLSDLWIRGAHVNSNAYKACVDKQDATYGDLIKFTL